MTAVFNNIRDLNDVALKPRLLQNLTSDKLPDETSPFQNPADISAIVSALKTHQLLSEQLPPLSSWTAAVDAWVHRILLLSRNHSPDKSWAGVCLLGVTCTGCTSERFLSSFSDWFNVIVPYIQQTGVSDIVRVASCAAASDLLTRLGGFSNTKKDGISCAGKLVQPILKILNGDSTEEMLEVAAHLLFTVLTYFPSSIHRYYDNAEAAIVLKIMSGNCSFILLKKLASCLASLPKSKGDEESWSLMMQKILLSLSALLDGALDGLEEESRRCKTFSLLVPPGKAPPPPLGGQIVGQVINSERSQQSVISIITCLMQSCGTMLRSSYQIQVVVPVQPLVAVIERVLMVNGSLPEALRPFTTAMQQELVCLHLPVLHQNALDILAALHKGLHNQVLPHAAEIVWLLSKYFERCSLPELRTNAYTSIRSLLISMGAGLALYISQLVIDNSSIDLKAASNDCDKGPGEMSGEPPSSGNRRKRRKHGSANGPLVDHLASVHSEFKEPQENQASISLKIAAVEALEALVIVGGSIRSDSWRSDIDHLLMEVALNACKGCWNHFGKPILMRGYGTASEDYQLVALRAFLASLLSPTSARPPYLAQGVELFLKGKQNAGTKVAEFCAQALLALEVLIHPRALPLVDTPLQTRTSSSRSTDYYDANGRIHGDHAEVYDIQDYVKMEDCFGSDVLDISQHEKPVVDEPLNKVTLKGDECVEPTSIDNNIEGNKDLVMLDVPPQTAPHGDTLVSPACPPLSSGTGIGNNAPDAINRESAAGVESRITGRTSDISQKRTVEDEDDDDPFPDIVDADPDTDSDS